MDTAKTKNLFLKNTAFKKSILFVFYFIFHSSNNLSFGNNLNRTFAPKAVNITGTVFNDLNNNTIINNSENGTNAGTNMYVYLVNALGIIEDSDIILATGTYSLSGLENSTYTIELSVINYPIGTDINILPIDNTPPTGYVTTGENGSNNAGSGDGKLDGVLTIATGASGATQQNFGITTMQPFTCSSDAYQVAGSQNANSTLYSYNVSSGVRTTISQLNIQANAIGYNKVDNLIWGYDRTNNKVARIDATGKTLSYLIPNLPNSDFNVGSMLSNNYLFLYNSGTAKYFIVDTDPTRSTYLNIVDPLMSLAIDTSPYGTQLPNPLDISDVAYNSTTGKLYGVMDPASPNKFKIATIDPLLATVSFSATQVAGGGFQGEGFGFGSAFTDANSTKLYSFANEQGRFYEIDLATNVSTLLSNSISAVLNDGTNCPTTNIVQPIDLISFSAKQFEDALNLTWKTANESNFSHFEVLKSSNAKEFGSVGKLPSIGESFYNYTDNEPIEGINYYQLRMVDLDGTSELSKVISVNFEKGSTYISVENPAINGEFMVNTNLSKPSFKLLNSIGQAISIDANKQSANTYNIRASNKTPGIYYLNIISDEKLTTKKILIP